MTAEKPTFHLLVVDDNPTNLELMARIVENHLPEVRSFTARSAREGYQLIASERIDGAFIDVQMPEINGFDMCRQLKADPQTSHIPVVLLTAHIATPKSRAEGLDAGAHDFISQPVSNIEMLARIRVMLRLQREREALARQNQQLHQQLEQNTAALRWLTGLLEAGGSTATDPQLLARLAAGLNGAAQPSVAQFAQLLLPELPDGWQDGLLRLALLDSIPLDLARRLVPHKDVEEVLVYLWRHNFHVEQREGGYIFSEQLRSYLLEQALVLLPEPERMQVHQQAACWYQERAEYLEALAHLLKAGLLQDAELLFSQTGLVLVGAEPKKAAALLKLVPEERIAKHGWFSLFYGSCQLYLAPGKVENWLELAQHRLTTAGDERGELLALSLLVRQHLFVDGRFALGSELLPRMEKLLERQQENLDPANFSMVLFSLALGHCLFVGHSKRGETYAREAVRAAQKAGLPALELDGRIACCYLAMAQGSSYVALSEIEQAWQLVSPRDRAPLILQVTSVNLMLHTGNLAGYREQRRQLMEQFKRSTLQQGALGAILALYEVEACLLEGDTESAAEMVQIGSVEGIAAGNPHLQSWMLQFRTLLHARAGRREEALRDLDQARALREEAGGGIYILANRVSCGEALLALDAVEAAEDLLERALAQSRETGDLLIRPGIHAALARVYQRRGETHRALEQLQEFLGLMYTKQQNCFACLDREMLDILPLAVENDVLPEVARRLAKEYLHSDIRDDGRVVPRLQVELLGTFRVRCGTGQWIEGNGFGGRGRHLLTELVFAQGQQLSIDTLCGRIWPESSADRARQSFDSTVLRLRKLLDDSCGEGTGRTYLTVERGIVCLRHIDVDALRYKTYVEQGRNLQRRGDLWQASHMLLAANRLWQGPLCAGFELPEEFPELQEIYAELHFEQLELLAGISERLDCAIDLETMLLEGVRNDPIRDSLIRRLLLLYRQQQEPVKQKRLLEKYRQALREEDFSPAEIEETVRQLEMPVDF